MKPRLPTSPDASLAELLLAYDEQLKAGQIGLDSGAGDADPPQLPAEQPSWLDEARHCLDLLERARPRDGSTTGVELSAIAAAADAPANEYPLRIGRFEVVHELGRGTHGIVLLARDPQLEREVALKVARPEVVLTPDLRARFLREGKAIAALNHAGLLPVFEAGSVGPICYLATAYCHGETLADWLEREDRPRDDRLAARLIATLAEAMQHAHGRGVVHRDLKPSNILLEKIELPSHAAHEAHEPLPWRPYIGDFGLAKVDSAAGDPTRTGAILGTPAYMAPEQATGDIERIGPASDIYALGAILYELLTGRVPFRKESELATLRAVEADEPLPPRRLRHAIPGDLEAVCLKCLEKEPARRYRSCTELADDLERFLADEPVRARRSTTLERYGRWCRRNPAVAGLSWLVIGLLATIAVGASQLAWRQSQQATLLAAARDTARKNFLEADAQRGRAEQNLQLLRQAVDKMLTEVGIDRLTSTPGMEPVRQRLFEEALAFYEKLLVQEGATPELRLETGRAMLRMGMMQRWLSRNDEARGSLQQAVEILRNIATGNASAENRLELSRALYQLGEVQSAMLEAVAAEASYREALALQTAVTEYLPEAAHFELARTHNGLGLVLSRVQGKSAEAESEFRTAAEMLRVLRTEQPDRHEVRYWLAVSLHNLAQKQSYTNQPQPAEEAYREALQEMEALTRELHYPDYRRELGSLWVDLGNLLGLSQPAQAEEAYRAGDRISGDLVDDFPSVVAYRMDLAKCRGNLGWLLSKQAPRQDEAETALRQANEILRSLVAERPQDNELQAALANNWNNQGILFNSRGQREAAMQAYEQAIELRRRQVASTPTPDLRSGLGAALHNLALEYKSHDVSRARVMLEEAIAHQLAALERTPQHAVYRSFLGKHYFLLSDLLISQHQLDAAADRARRLAALATSDWANSVRAADLLRRCRLEVDHDASLDDMARGLRREQWLQEIREVLRTAGECLPETVREAALADGWARQMLMAGSESLAAPELATRLTERATAAAPEQAEYWLTRAAACVNEQRWTDAEVAVQQARRCGAPDDTLTCSLQAILEVRRGMRESAGEWLAKAKQAAAESPPPDNFNFRDWVLELARRQIMPHISGGMPEPHGP